MKIRKATVKDAKIISKIKIDGWKFAYKNILPNSFLENLNEEKTLKDFEKWIYEEKLTIYLVEDENEIRGFISIYLKDNTCNLKVLYLDPKYIGKGYGTKLLEYIEKNYKIKKIILLVLEGNNLGINFYKKKGFNFNGNKEIFEIDGKKFNELEMEKVYS